MVAQWSPLLRHSKKVHWLPSTIGLGSFYIAHSWERGLAPAQQKKMDGWQR